MEKKFEYHRHLQAIANADLEVIVRKDREYGASWKKRGGTSAFHIMVRKADRIETAVEKINYDIFQALRNDTRKEGLIDDIRDLRRYLDLLEAWAIEEGILPNPISGKMIVRRPNGVPIETYQTTTRAADSGQEHPFGYVKEDDNDEDDNGGGPATYVPSGNRLASTGNVAKSERSQIRRDRPRDKG
jgi:hypothetical protein